MIYSIFRRAGIRQVAYVPDAGLNRLIQLCQSDPEIADVVLTTEEEGIGLVAGAALGGQRSAILMQSSGVGNWRQYVFVGQAVQAAMPHLCDHAR